MVQLVDKFSHDLDQSDLKQALSLKEKLSDASYDQYKLKDLKVHSSTYFEKAFKFPTVAGNEYSQDQLNLLEAAEKNLNDNIDNDKLQTAFVNTAKTVEDSLKAKYGDSWTAPEGHNEYTNV